MMFAVIYCSGVFGGAITAILFNIPGAPENAPTCFDGYPMTQRGDSGKAIGAAVIFSAIGGVASAVVMMAATPIIADWAVSAFGSTRDFRINIFWFSGFSLNRGSQFMEGLDVYFPWSGYCRYWYRPSWRYSTI